MPQTAVSGTGWNEIEPEQYQYRMAYVGNYEQPLNYDKHGYPVHTSAVRQMHYTGASTWNELGYDYSAYANTLRRVPLEHQEARTIINYIGNNPVAPMNATPIAIANYAISTGLIYVGGNNGNWGGVQTGTVTPGGYNAY